MAMKPCKECNREISSSAKTCPHCGKDQRNWFARHKFLTFLGIVLAIIVMSSMCGGNEGDPATVVSGNAEDTREVLAEVGDNIITEKFEITITSVKERAEVGKDFFSSRPSEGGTYIVVDWQYKNISDKPIRSFSTPTVKLVDKDLEMFSTDIAASSNYATECNLDRKIFSDLNPGITVKDAEVFEISKELYQTVSL